MTLESPLKKIAFACLLIFVFAISGTAFGEVGCHSAGEGFQGAGCSRSHTPEITPHLYSETETPCACDQLACRILKSRSRLKRQVMQLVEVEQPSVFEFVLPSAAIFSGRYDSSLLYLASHSLVLLRTVILRH